MKKNSTADTVENCYEQFFQAVTILHHLVFDYLNVAPTLLLTRKKKRSFFRGFCLFTIFYSIIRFEVIGYL